MQNNDTSPESSSQSALQQAAQVPPTQTNNNAESLYTEQATDSADEKIPADNGKNVQQTNPTYTGSNSRNNNMY